MRPLAALPLFALALGGCRGRPVTSEECDRLLDRYTEMLLRADDPKASGADVETAKAKAREIAAGNKPFRRCTRDVSREQMDCSLAAYNADEIERCLVPVP